MRLIVFLKVKKNKKKLMIKKLIISIVWTCLTIISEENPYLMSFEELSQIQVVSFDTQERTISETPAGVSIITSDQISNSQHTTIAELLRDTPGVHVASMDSHSWAIGVRGLNRRYSNKLLVLIDGRRIYTPVFAGVHWGMQNIPLAEIEQIEIIRGPGATLWGANAVNGVINIITKKATQTQGSLLQLGGGNYERLNSFLRYGSKINNDFFYRISAQQIVKDNFTVTNGSSAHDKWQETRLSFRFDWFPAIEHEFNFDTHHYYGERSYNQPYFNDFGQYTTLKDDKLNAQGHSLRARWDHESGPNSYYLQSYFDYYLLENPGRNEQASSFNIDFRHKHSVNPRYDFSWGSSVYAIRDKVKNNDALVSFYPAENHQFRTDFFIQNDIVLVENKLDLSIGTKMGYNEATDWEFQPSARLHFNLSDSHHFWTAISRPVRIPTKTDLNLRQRIGVIPFANPVELLVLGDNVDSEEVIVYEIGYKFLGQESSFDLTFFYNDYKKFHNIVSAPNNPFNFPIDDSLTGYSYGFESSYKQRIYEHLQLSINYSYLDTNFDFQNPFDNSFTGVNVENMASISSEFSLSNRLLHKASLYYTDQFSRTRTSPRKIGSNLRFDTGFVYDLNKDLRFEIWGLNLLENRTTEFADSAAITAEVPRSFFIKLSYQF